MIVLVTGGRDFTNGRFLDSILDAVHMTRPITLIIHGDARGADTLAGLWAKKNGIAEEPHPADWQKHGRAAGPIRNSEMLNRGPELVVAFPGGVGTADMVAKARKAGVRVIDHGDYQG